MPVQEHSTGSILAAIFGALAAAYIGFKIRHHRMHLRRVVGILDDADLNLISSLDRMVKDGEVKPMVLEAAL